MRYLCLRLPPESSDGDGGGGGGLLSFWADGAAGRPSLRDCLPVVPVWAAGGVGVAGAGVAAGWGGASPVFVHAELVFCLVYTPGPSALNKSSKPLPTAFHEMPTLLGMVTLVS